MFSHSEPFGQVVATKSAGVCQEEKNSANLADLADLSAGSMERDTYIAVLHIPGIIPHPTWRDPCYLLLDDSVLSTVVVVNGPSTTDLPSCLVMYALQSILLLASGALY